MKSYKTITKEKGLDIIGYQNQFFGKKIWEQSPNPLVLAAGTSAGKTITTLIALEIFYSDKKNYNKRSLLIPASKTVLRDNIRIAIEEFNPSFGYFVATNKKELEEAIADKSYQVIIALPQTLNNNYSLLPKIHNFILDEAHQWYFKTTITKIIKHINPTKQLLLTGTPSRFIAKENKFDFFFVPVMDLYDEKRVSNIKVEVVSSSYDFKQNDYLSNYGNLKNNKTNSDAKTKEAFTMVCEEMILKLRSQLGNKYLTNVKGANKIASMFNDLDKTIIFCHSLKQSNAIFKQLNSIKGLKDKVLISHSENDSDSEYFEMFRTNDKYKVLVAVDRGRLGYNLPNLFNVVDFTLTQSLDMILQMMGRVLRIADNNKQKVYYKVATKNTAGYFVDLMTAALCLFKMEWYSKFNGKNMGGIQIPKVLTKSTKTKQNSTNSKNTKKPTQQLKSLEELGIPLDLNLFRQDIMYSQSDKFGTIAWTTLDECRRKFFDIDNGFKKDFISFIEARKIVQKLKFNNALDYIQWSQTDRPDNIPSNPQKNYILEWNGWGDFLGTKKIANQNREYLEFEKAHKIVLDANIKNQKEYQQWCKTKKPSNIPSDPKNIYKEYISFENWIGKDLIPEYHKKGFISYQKCKSIINKNKVYGRREYTKFYRKNKLKYNIPSRPHNTYNGHGWENWDKFLVKRINNKGKIISLK